MTGRARLGVVAGWQHVRVIEVRAATPDRWDDVATVMGTRGDPARCWCQFFRLRGKAWQTATGNSNRAALRAQMLDQPAPPGVLAYRDGEPVGWCAVAPRSAYPRLASSQISIATSDEPGLWSVTCFVVRVGHRRQGVSAALLDGATGFAHERGARILEAYPIEVADTDTSSATLYPGPLSMFLNAGFVEVARPKPARAIVRRSLGD